MNKQLKEYNLRVNVKGFQCYYVQANSRKEAIKKILECSEDVEIELDDIQIDIPTGGDNFETYVNDNIE